jgi:type I restriction enzyme S subunit
VLEGVEGKLYQPLLPWIMLSQRFTEHSVRESKGSTNPYINFPDIAKFDFDLPLLDQQQRIADILWAVDHDEQAKATSAENARSLLAAAAASPGRAKGADYHNSQVR